MQAQLFYQTAPQGAIPLFCLSQAQWEDAGLDSFSQRERNLLQLQQFKAQTGDVGIISDSDGNLSKVYLGTGKNGEELAIACAALRLPPAVYLLQPRLSRAALVNWGLAQYRFMHYKKQDIAARKLVVEEKDLPALLAEVDAVFLVRDLINMPTNDFAPQNMATVLANIAKETGATFQEWVGRELLENNFPAIYAVGCASGNAPRLLSLTWGDERHPRVSLIGKGVCFDSGGLDIKPALAMRLMKKDMGGAAHVIGLAQWIMKQNLPVRLQVLIPAIENSIGPDAFRPGDILTMRNGLTVEVDNTDAEGRLVLADALVKACEKKPELIIDFATLTGSARMAVGTEIAALFSNDDSLAQAIMESSLKVSDPVWRLPLFQAYESLLESSLADISNCSVSPFAGAITAALFLQRFITAPVSWIHFDIMAWNLSSKPGKPEGGEAMGLRAVAHYLLEKYGFKN
jgi:leucyl aminopeptidase